MLKCECCANTKEKSEFYADPKRATGYKKDCKDCYKAKRRNDPVIKTRDRERMRKKYSDPQWLRDFNARRRQQRYTTRAEVRC